VKALEIPGGDTAGWIGVCGEILGRANGVGAEGEPQTGPHLDLLGGWTFLGRGVAVQRLH